MCVFVYQHIITTNLDRQENPVGVDQISYIYRCLVAFVSDSEEMLQKVAALWVYVYQHIITTKLSSQSEMKDTVGKISAPTKLVQESFLTQQQCLDRRQILSMSMYNGSQA